MKAMKMQVAENLAVEVTPSADHEFVMTTAEVAKGYGVSPNTLRSCKREHQDELVEGKHYFTSVGISNAGCKSVSYTGCNGMLPPVKRVFWTKRGIVRLGFFIRSERARMFRDWAEDLILTVTDRVEQAQQLKLFPEPTKRRHNRLTPERMISILEDVAKIDDRDLRLSLVDKLTKC